MAKNNSNVVAELMVNIGATANIEQVTTTAKQVQKIIDKEIYQEGKKKNGLSINFKSLEKGEQDILNLTKQIKELGVEMGAVGSDGKFLKDENGKATELERIYNRLLKLLPAVRTQMDNLNPSALKIENSLRRARLQNKKIGDAEKKRIEKQVRERELRYKQNKTNYPQDYFNKSAIDSASVFNSKEGMLYERRNLARIDREKKSIQELQKYEQKRLQVLQKQNALHQQGRIALEQQLKTTKSLTGQFGQLGAMARQYFNLWAVKAYAQNIVNITAEFERQRRALGSLIGDQARAIGDFSKLKAMALESPFTALQLNTTAKNLAAYSIKEKDLLKTTKMLGDIAAATGVDIQRLVLAYGQVKTAHYLRGQEVRQFTEAGVPLLEELANVFTKRGTFTSAEQVQKMISNKGVRFGDVQEALENMTSGSGRFANFQYEIAQTTYGKIQKFQDALQQGWDKLGEQTSGVFNKILDSGIKIAKNMSGYVKVLTSSLAVWTAIHAIRKADMAITNRESALLQRTAMARQLQSTASSPTMANYYGIMGNSFEKQALQIGKMRQRMEALNIATRRANMSASMLGKGFNIVGKNIRRAGMGIKLFFATFKSALISTGVGVLITALGAVVGKIWSIIDANKTMKKDLLNIDREVVKSTIRSNEKLKMQIDSILKMKEGSQEQVQAIQKIQEEWKGVLSPQDLSIRNLKKMNGEYDSLYSKIQNIMKLWHNIDKRYVIQERFGEEAEKKLYPYIVGGEAVEKYVPVEWKSQDETGNIYPSKYEKRYVLNEVGKEQTDQVVAGVIDILTENNPKNDKEYTDYDIQQAVKKVAQNLGYDPRNWSAKAGTARIIKKYLKNLERYPITQRPDLDAPSKTDSGSQQEKDPTEGWNNFIAFLDKAKERSEKLKEYYSEAIALAKTEEEFKDQFEQIAEEYKRITGKDSLRDMIKSDESYKEIIKAYIEEAKKASASASDQWYKHAYDKFRFNFLSPKLTEVEIRATDRYIKEFMSNLDRQLENARGRINIFEKIVGITGNESLAGKFAEALYGKGGLSEIGVVRKNFEDAVREFAKDIDFGKMLQEEAFDWKGVEDKILTLPSSLRDSLLKAFKELKSANEKSLEDALNSYKKQLSIEEKRVTAHNEMYRKMRAIDETYNLDEEGKRMAKDNVFKAYQKQMLDLELEEIRASDVYLQLFNNIEHAGVASLSALRMELIKLRDNAKDLSTKDLKSLNSEIKKIEDVLKPKKYTLENALSLPSKKELTKKMTELYAVQNEYNKKQAQLSEIARQKSEKQELLDILASFPDDSDFAKQQTEEYKAEKEALTQQEQQITAETEALKQQMDTLQMGIYDVESLHNKAIERMQSKLESYNQTLSDMANVGNGVVQVLQNINTLSYKGKESTYLSHVASSISTGNSLTQGIIGLGQNGLNMFKSAKGTGLADLLSQRKEYGATINSINSIFGPKTMEQTEQLDGAMEGLKATTGELYSTLGLMAIQLGVTIYDSLVKIHDQRIQDEIDDINDKIKELDKNLTAIENRMNKSAGNRYFQGMKEQMLTYQKQAELAEQQAEKARHKKRKDKDEIESYVDKAKQSRQQAIQKQEEMFQYLLGSDVKGYLENIVSVFTQAKQAGENTFSALKKSFGEMVSSMVQKMILTSVIETKFQRLFDQITEMANRGGVGTVDVDKMIATGLQATQEANNALSAMYPLIQRINTAFGVTASTAGSLSAGVKGMSEETAASMSGYLMANFDRLGEIQKSVFAIQKSVAGNTASGMMTQYQNDAIAHLAQIEANTLKSANKTSDLYDMLSGMRVVNNTGSGAVYALQVSQE